MVFVFEMRIKKRGRIKKVNEREKNDVTMIAFGAWFGCPCKSLQKKRYYFSSVFHEQGSKMNDLIGSERLHASRLSLAVKGMGILSTIFSP